MQKIIPHLWYDKEALEAVKLYVSLFNDSKIINISTIPDTPSGDAEFIEFEIDGFKISAISAGPYFKFNPSSSLMVSCADKDEVERLYNNLISGGMELMPLGEYPFSKYFAWIQDKYGLNWQFLLNENVTEHGKIRPNLLFASDICGKAEDAINYYNSVFSDSKKGYINYYKSGEAQDERALINYGEIDILGTQIVAMDHGAGGDFIFNEAFSFMVICENQEEIDYYWDKLSFIKEAEECGWIKDKFGLSWQIVPALMSEIFAEGSKEEIKRVTDAVLSMKKLNIQILDNARKGV